MPFLLIPRTATTQSAQVWVAVINEGVDLDLHPVTLATDAGDLAIQGNWNELTSDDKRYWIRHKVVPIPDLKPRQRCDVALVINGETRAQATVTTLPAALPTADDRPFTVLLGSCFWTKGDNALRVDLAADRMGAGNQPDLKIFCGDQVYLDAPWTEYSVHTHTEAELQGKFLDTYLESWGWRGLGMSHLLRNGSNWFCSDDHEFWNNAPNRAPAVLDSWSPTGAGTDTWKRVARSLYELFQTDRLFEEFRVGPLSFYVADTRLDRTADRSQVMTPQELVRMRNWVAGLTGPGLLVLGQPVFDEKAGFLKGPFMDYTLPNYDQYGDIVAMLQGVSHDVVILTGDVHYARAAWCKPFADPTVTEIISSPLALVADVAGRKWSAAPGRFPAAAIAGVVGRDVENGDLRESDDHFLTLEFTAQGDSVMMRVRHWPITNPGKSSIGFERRLR